MNSEALGAPNIKIGGLQIWVHSKPPLPCAPDENWINVTAHCGESGASVWVHGSILTLSAIKGWAEGCQGISRNLSGSAVLDGIEPELLATMEISDRLGHLKLTVIITPDHLRQQHRFEFELDQSHLPPMIEQCKRVLSTFD
jgi:hypothetical protein